MRIRATHLYRSTTRDADDGRSIRIKPHRVRGVHSHHCDRHRVVVSRFIVERVGEWPVRLDLDLVRVERGPNKFKKYEERRHQMLWWASSPKVVANFHTLTDAFFFGGNFYLFIRPK